MRKRLKLLITLTLLMVLAVLLYFRFSNRTVETKKPAGDEDTAVSEVDKVLSKDLSKNYPLTAREVVNLYTRIQKCYYNEECTPDEIVSLAYMTTYLFDEELVANNPFDEYYSELLEDIEQYHKTESTISRVILDKSSDVVYSTVDDIKYASINCIYYVKNSKGTSRTKETYALRKDEEGRWKILGWMITPEEDD
ncbi:MAG: hypothetical protein GX225_00410 [Clostridiales bacterium]|nr:hypothetical protein [Clostridiales bacterium]